MLVTEQYEISHWDDFPEIGAAIRISKVSRVVHPAEEMSECKEIAQQGVMLAGGPFITPAAITKVRWIK